MAAAVKYAPEDPTLPKPWKGLVDGNTGYLYFWNPVTNVTQYEKPDAPPIVHEPPKPVEVENSSRDYNWDGTGNGGGSDKIVQCDDKPSAGATNGERNEESTRIEEESKHPASVCKNGSDMPNQESDCPSSKSSASVVPTHGSDVQSLKSPASIGPNTGSAPSADSYRRQHEITVIGNNVPAPFTSFQLTGFPPEILKEVLKAGFSAPTPIQAQSWPIALQNHDIVAVAKTGSGKTLGYLMPGFAHIRRSRKNSKLGPTVLVLSPTRELATQIQDEAEKFGQSSNISSTCLYGGAPKGPQIRDIEQGVDIVVATPGRLNDILEMGKISFSQISYLVLDEADRMLDMGFEPQIRKIIKAIPPRRQTLMYTATWPKQVRNLAAEFLNNPIQVNIGRTDELVANKSISQYVEVVNHNEKNRRLEQIVRSTEPRSKIIIFCSTKRMCDQLVGYIPRQLGAAAIHGDKSQGERDHVLSQFRNGSSPILVATDVAARGLDVKDIKVVVNYDFPTGIEDYVHRIGRTGRGGATGAAYTFFCDKDAKHAKDLVKILEGANQKVPPQLRELASRGYGGGFGSGFGGGRGSGRGGFGRDRSRSPPKW
ncbi:RNA helicase [Ranunculus cassubicifolius]